jgi:hypothetical protein
MRVEIELLRGRDSPETLFFAARDYVKISRASTDATGASLTVFGAKLWSCSGGLFSLVGNEERVPHYKKSVTVALIRISGLQPKYLKASGYHLTIASKTIVIAHYPISSNNDLPVGDWW